LRLTVAEHAAKTHSERLESPRRDRNDLLFLKCGKNGTISTGQSARGSRVYLGLSISWSLASTPGYFQARFSGPATLERFAFDEFVSIKPGLGIGKYHKNLPENSCHTTNIAAQEPPQPIGSQNYNDSGLIINVASLKSRAFGFSLRNTLTMQLKPAADIPEHTLEQFCRALSALSESTIPHGKQ
jgi:hypothetical protein